MLKHFIFVVFAVATILGQSQAEKAKTPAPVPHDPQSYEATEVQKLRLENAQLRVVATAAQIAPLQKQYQEQMGALLKMCETVRKENGWPKEVQCSPQTLEFGAVEGSQAGAGAPRQPVPPPPAPTKEEQKK